ncbi:MAG: alpha/beta hydrolase [Proteobacteria bacterium]|nr:alpha/beta hydrolase [Pseudomonadota bacterium]
MAFTKTRTFAAALLLGYALVAPPIARSDQAYSDTLVTVSADVRLRVIDAGPPQAQSILLIPGWCFTADIWTKQIEALSDRYRVVAVDPRSQGRSTILDHSNSPDHRAADIASLIKTLHLRKPVIVGWSQGVQDVAAYALAFGTDGIGGIVLVDAPVSAGAASLDAKEAAETLGLLAIYAGSPRNYLAGMMPYIFKQPLSPSELDTIVTAALRTPSSIGVANLALDFYGKDYRPSFKRMNVPALLIVAGTAPDKNEQIQQPIPNATSAVVDGAGHAVFYDEPTKFNDLLIRFLADRVKHEASK